MIKFLLKQYENIFATPKGLPPNREVDHCILTMVGQKLINVQPYEYARASLERRNRESNN